MLEERNKHQNGSVASSSNQNLSVASNSDLNSSLALITTDEMNLSIDESWLQKEVNKIFEEGELTVVAGEIDKYLNQAE